MLQSSLYRAAYAAGERRATADAKACPSYFPSTLKVTRGTLFCIIRAAYPQLQQPALTVLMWRHKTALLEAYRAAYYLRRHTLSVIRPVGRLGPISQPKGA